MCHVAARETAHLFDIRLRPKPAFEKDVAYVMTECGPLAFWSGEQTDITLLAMVAFSGCEAHDSELKRLRFGFKYHLSQMS
jgi:hypothetical protein